MSGCFTGHKPRMEKKQNSYKHFPKELSSKASFSPFFPAVKKKGPSLVLPSKTASPSCPGYGVSPVLFPLWVQFSLGVAADFLLVHLVQTSRLHVAFSSIPRVDLGRTSSPSARVPGAWGAWLGGHKGSFVPSNGRAKWISSGAELDTHCNRARGF